MSAYKVIEAKELFDLMSAQSVTIVDVRNDHEVVGGVIPGALHIPLAMIPVSFDTLSKTTPLIIYCHTGIRSAQASAYIASKGYENVHNLYGGVVAWGKSGYEFARLA